MKKQLFLLGLAVAAMSSCTNDEVLEMPSVQKAIGFDSFVNKSSRAVTETVYSSVVPAQDGSKSVGGLNKFNVFGYYTYTDANQQEQVMPVFNNKAVTASVNTINTVDVVAWAYAASSEEIKYWTQNQYQFAAYANSNTSSALNNASFSGATLTFDNYTVSDEYDLVADVVSKDNSGLGAYNDKVAFNFVHMLTKIYFQIQNTDAKYKMRVTTPLNIIGVKNQGTGTIIENNDYVNWIPTNGGTTRADFVPEVAVNGLSNITNNIFAASTGIWTSQEYLVMPQSVSGIKFTIAVEFIDSDGQVVTTKSFTEKDFSTTVQTWKNGVSYCYKISLPTAAKPIEFDVTNVAGWTNHSSSIELNPNDPDSTN